jgi:hypothetical protein
MHISVLVVGRKDGCAVVPAWLGLAQCCTLKGKPENSSGLRLGGQWKGPGVTPGFPALGLLL